MITHDFSQSSQIDPEVIAKRLQTLEAKAVPLPVSINGAQIEEAAFDKRLNAATGVVIANQSAGAAPDLAKVHARLKAAGV
jgi:hypothetical protein